MNQRFHSEPDSTPLVTVIGLVELGFTLTSKSSTELHFHFGNFKLYAMQCFSPRVFRQMVHFDGFLMAGESAAQMEFILPPVVESVDQLKAFLAYYLDKAIKGVAPPKREPPWLAEGRALVELLPWRRDSREYDNRDRCRMDRKWLKLVLGTLGEHLCSMPDEARVKFSFDGKVLRVDCGDQVVAAAAQGPPWRSQWLVSVRSLRSLPRRIRYDPAELSCFRGELRIGNWCYQASVGEGEVRGSESDELPRRSPG